VDAERGELRLVLLDEDDVDGLHSAPHLLRGARPWGAPMWAWWSIAWLRRRRLGTTALLIDLVLFSSLILETDGDSQHKAR
jgi:hypothetical protein